MAEIAYGAFLMALGILLGCGIVTAILREFGDED